MKKRILFLFPNRGEPRISEVRKGKIPRERLYGVPELLDLGWDVRISDHRWESRTSNLRRRLREYVEVPNLATIRAMRSADIVVVKDSFSVTFLAESGLARTPLVYLDAMFSLPESFRGTWSASLNLRHAEAICCFSHHQASVWINRFGLPSSRIEVLPYCIDTEFYPEVVRTPTEPRYALSVGRDMGRDHPTLIRACEKLGLMLKLITLPYLVPDWASQVQDLEVLEYVSYEHLFDLYSRAAVAVVPLKANLNYPSGVRASLESVALGVPTVVSDTPVLQEYFEQGVDVLFTPPEDVDGLANRIASLLGNPVSAENLSNRGKQRIRSQYPIGRFVQEFEGVLNGI